jgi:hypothetical protein
MTGNYLRATRREFKWSGMNTCRSVDSKEVAWNWSGRAILWRTGIELRASGEETIGNVSTVFYYCQLLLLKKYHSNETGGSRGV